MHHPLRFHGLALAIAMVLGQGAAYAHPSDTNNPVAANVLKAQSEPASEKQAALDAELFYEILIGEMAASNGALMDAQALMMEAARTSGSEQLYKRATQLALQSRSGEKALVNARAWLEAAPQSTEANKYILQILVALNRIADSEPYLRKLVNNTPASGKSNTFLSISQLYNRASDKALAADVVERALADDLADKDIGPLAWATVGHMRLLAGNKAGALDAVSRAQELKPDTGAIVLLALELIETGSPELEPMVQQYVDKSDSAQLRLVYARILLNQQRLEPALVQLQAITKSAPDQLEAWALLAQLQLQAGKLDQAAVSLDRLSELLDKSPSSVERSAAQSQLLLLKSDLADRQGKFAEADKLLQRIEDAPNLLNIQARRANLVAKQGRLADAQAIIQAVPASTEGQQRLKRIAEIQLLRDFKKLDQAYVLQTALQADEPKDNELAYDTALLAERLGKHDEMEKLLREIIERQPDFHHAYNALGYSLADRGIRLDEAQQLIGKALELAPNDPFIMDSMAWLMFRKGDLAQAQQILEQAFAKRADAEIAAHLGEVLWAQGKKEQAKEVWQQGLSASPKNEALKETLSRLQVAL